jgi:Asp/Glu/hydantoin racemase
VNNATTILYLAHSKPGSYIFEETARYLKTFPDVEIRGISEDGLPFPKCVEELTFMWLLKAMDHGLDRDFLAAVEKAERDGYGATTCASAGDFSLNEAKARLTIPYVGMGWASYWKAIQVGGKFTHFHTHMAELIAPVSVQQIAAYGFADKLVSVEYIDVDIYKCMAKHEEPNYEQLMEIFLPKVEKCAGKGARAITIGCGSPDLSRLARMLDEVALKKYDVRVLPPIDTVVNVARELMEKKARECLENRGKSRP